MFLRSNSIYSNANDYSGNGNNSVPSNVMFVSNWWQGYTPL